MMKHQQKPYWKLDLPFFSHGYWKCIFVDSSTDYIGPPISVHVSVK